MDSGIIKEQLKITNLKIGEGAQVKRGGKSPVVRCETEEERARRRVTRDVNDYYNRRDWDRFKSGSGREIGNVIVGAGGFILLLIVVGLIEKACTGETSVDNL